MTQIAAIVESLLKGEILSIMDGFNKFACSNLPRELSRSVEQKFGITISKEKVKHKSQYGHTGVYYRYRLNRTAAYNQCGIKLMKQYLKDQLKSSPSPRTEKEKIRNKQQSLFLDSI